MKPHQKILFLDTVHSHLEDKLTLLGFHSDILPNLTKEKLSTIIHQYTGIVVRSKITLDNELLEKAILLKFIARAGAGMENIDVDFANKKGIECINAPEGNRDAVAEHALGMILALFIQLNKANEEVKNGIWDREGNRGIELMGKTIGIIGYGNTGSSFAKRLMGFDVEVLAYDKYKKGYANKFTKEVSMETIFNKADILSLHIPLTDETNYLVNDAFINMFKKNIYIINTSRGKVVSTDDLAKNMKAGKILGACLDVLEYESSSFETLCNKDIPSSLQYLMNSNNVLLSPHIAGWTHESYQKLSEVLANKIKALIL